MHHVLLGLCHVLVASATRPFVARRLLHRPDLPLCARAVRRGARAFTDVVAQHVRFAQVAELLKRPVLDPPHPLALDVEPARHLVKGAGVLAAEGSTSDDQSGSPGGQGASTKPRCPSANSRSAIGV